MKIPLTIPYLDSAEETAVVQTIRSGWITQGPQVALLEKDIENYTHSKYAVATSSATTALHLSLMLLNIQKGDEIIVPSFTFIATANVVIHAGAKPVFVDVDYDTLNINPSLIQKKITKKTRAIIPVDYAGIPCDIGAINKIAKDNNLLVVEDAAAALGSEYKNKKIGSLADITCFSFHARKIVTTGEGGMLTTNNEKYANKAKILRHHGMSTSDLVRHSSKNVYHESYQEIGYNFRMSDIQAAVGVAQFSKINNIINLRTKLANKYSSTLKGNPLIQTPQLLNNTKTNWQSYIIKLRKNKYLSRDKLMQKLLDEGIATRRGAMAIHKEGAYKELVGKLKLPVTEEAAEQTITLPLYPQMTDTEQEFVIQSLLRNTKV